MTCKIVLVNWRLRNAVVRAQLTGGRSGRLYAEARGSAVSGVLRVNLVAKRRFPWGDYKLTLRATRRTGAHTTIRDTVKVPDATTGTRAPCAGARASVPRAGFEPAAYSLGGSRSIRLSYRGRRAQRRRTKPCGQFVQAGVMSPRNRQIHACRISFMGEVLDTQ